MGMEQEVADLMAHGRKTADKHYHIRQKMKTASKAGDVIRSYFSKKSNNASPRKYWLKEEENVLNTVFEDEMEDGIVPLDKVKIKYKSLGIDASKIQVYNKLQCLHRYSPYLCLVI